MNLEAIEQRVLAYLKQSQSPLAPIEQLERHLRQRDEFETIDRAELLGFLSRHELFRVIHPDPVLAGPGGSELFEEIGMPAGPYVVLETRLPAGKELAALMAMQLAMMADALSTALREARDQGQAERVDQFHALLKRVQDMQQKIGEWTE